MITQQTYTKLGPRAVTLIELIFTVVIVAISSLGTLSVLQYGITNRQAMTERNAAMRAASDILEDTKRRFYSDLAPGTFAVTLDSNGTPSITSDDVTGNASLSFWNLNGTQLGVGANPLPSAPEIIEARVTVTWNALAYGGASRTQVLSTLLSAAD